MNTFSGKVLYNFTHSVPLMFFNPRAADSIPPVLAPVKETFDAITLIKAVIRRNIKG